MKLASETARRRNIVLAILAILLVTFILFTTPLVNTDRLKHIVPGHSDPSPSKKPNTSTDESTAVSDDVRTSKFHYLIPGSKPKLRLCHNLLSSAANRYPVPVLMGFHGQGEFNASKTHLAKLRAITRYLETLDPKNDDDLVLIVDGYDVIQQLPPEIMIERYFGVVDRANTRVAKRFNITVEEVYERDLQTTVFFGPDKTCWPDDQTQARCWAIPESNLPQDTFGPNEGNGDMETNDPRWLNSGTIIGPVGDTREFMQATLDEIDETFDEMYPYRTSDQYYLSNVFGRQEYYRSLLASKDGKVRGGPSGRVLPLSRTEDQVVEFHGGIEYESTLFQTRAGNTEFYGWGKFKHAGLTYEMDHDLFEEGSDFKPYTIQMPPNVLAALSRLYDAIPEAHPESTAAQWIGTVNLGVNFVTRHIYALWHCTGAKISFDTAFTEFWFYPFAMSLTKASVKALQGDETLITDQIIDGRRWAYHDVYPTGQEDIDEFGGAWSDEDEDVKTWVDWDDLCGDHFEILFGGELAIEPEETEPEAEAEAEVEVEAEIEVEAEEAAEA